MHEIFYHSHDATWFELLGNLEIDSDLRASGVIWVTFGINRSRVVQLTCCERSSPSTGLILVCTSIIETIHQSMHITILNVVHYKGSIHPTYQTRLCLNAVTHKLNALLLQHVDTYLRSTQHIINIFMCRHNSVLIDPHYYLIPYEPPSPTHETTSVAALHNLSDFTHTH